jgi:heme oxygenase
MRNTSSDSTENCTALQVIRDRTTPLHAQLDSGSYLSILLTPACSLADYKSTTSALATAYQAVDSTLANGVQYCPVALPAYVPRLPYLLADLQNLDATSLAPPVFELAAPFSNASYLGMRYVIEGSNLGARVIYRALQHSAIAQTIAVDQCYWSHAQAWQLAWPALMRQLSDLHTAQEYEEAADSACLVFEHFIRFLLPVRN